jgi:phosphate transport system ATP-binding protein
MTKEVSVTSTRAAGRLEGELRGPLALEPPGEAAKDDGGVIRLVGLSVFYGRQRVINEVSLAIPRGRVTVFMGPSGCGKTTLLRTINRMNDGVSGFRVTGRVLLDGTDVYSSDVDPILLRTRVGMVFQKPNPFPLSVFDNVAFGPRIHRLAKSREALYELVRESLQKAALWEEVRDRLNRSALELSGGQQQRLCIARALAVRPEVLLMDEPASALDPGSTSKIEELMVSLRENYTVVLVTHNMQQAARVGDSVAFLHRGDLVEFGPTEQVFRNPREPLTERYIRGSL